MSKTRVWLLALALVAACGADTIIHDIDEKQANSIVVLLADYDITARKVPRDTGRKITYSIAVPSAARLKALKKLQDHDYPRRLIEGYGEVFAESGLIPTSAEEKAKKLRAIEGEIERQLMLMHGMLDAQVNLVIPEDSALRTSEQTMPNTTASVTLKHLPGKGSKPNSQWVQAIVAASVEKLTSDHVVVVMAEAKGEAAGECADAPASRGKGIFGRLPSRTQLLLLTGIIILILILSGLLVIGQLRLRNVRSRFIRLQNEIARARRKGPDGAPAASE